ICHSASTSCHDRSNVRHMTGRRRVRTGRRTIVHVAALALNEIAPFELGVVCEVFGTDRTDAGFPAYDFKVCTPDGQPVITQSGFSLIPHADLTPLAEADLVAVPAHPIDCPVAPEVAKALSDAAERGAYMLSVCSGAFLLGEAGLLDGRCCTTHWRYTDELAKRFPLAQVQPNALYVRDGNIFTSAGTAAGIDPCLDLVRSEHGPAL